MFPVQLSFRMLVVMYVKSYYNLLLETKLFWVMCFLGNTLLVLIGTILELDFMVNLLLYKHLILHILYLSSTLCVEPVLF